MLTMKLSTRHSRQRSPALGKFMVALALGALLGGNSMVPALGKDDDGRHDKGWHKGKQRGERNDHYRGERDDYYYRDRRGPNYYQPYYYSAPVYAPPPVYSPPQPSRGISLFFPLDLRR